ncbi:DEAD/DEAH box helicase [Archangium primigenium]|uniref:DEAD/DEAH box helicase n=1 Tax=[Archangium] primigenium TaxID=2792470 RepID=UPI00195B48EE|nr:DEAD/DEAH box helicase [Archangium primigenium]MBM7113865.1 DEAD/DEAH box helicase [Archangium primigenium]
MELNLNRNRLALDPATRALVDYLKANANRLNLDKALIYHEFPIFRDAEGELVTSRLFLVSPTHGVVVFGTSNATRVAEHDLGNVERELDEVFNSIFSRLLRNKALRKGKREIVCPAEAAIFAPFLDGQPITDEVSESELIRSDDELDLYLQDISVSPLDATTFTELVATVEGAKGLVRPQKRESDEANPNSKGAQVGRLEAEISSFDRKQKTAYMSEVTGAQRIRGLAGSGKTVILAMKAALTHLRFPDATILYTFYTKSLYQHVKRLITRFYRQFNDVDPDWGKVRVLHAWGGSNYAGVYSDACKAFGQRTLTFSDATRQRPGDEFGFICAELLASKSVHPLYDYAFIDEGQDFPASFLQLCRALTQGSIDMTSEVMSN